MTLDKKPHVFVPEVFNRLNELTYTVEENLLYFR